jgi:NHS family xanthosine MFS transporter
MIVTGLSALHYNVPAENNNQTLTSKFGLDSFVFKQKKMAIFFVLPCYLGRLCK